LGEPLEWILGRVRFAGSDLEIGPGVFVPRRHTEQLVAHAAPLLPTGGRAVDLCTGCGAVAAALQALDPTASIVGIDVDLAAAAYARRNGVRAIVGDLDGATRAGSFHLVTAVAPYVPTDELRFLPRDVQRFEPTAALDGGADGLDVVRRVVRAAGRLLSPGGWLVTEIGGEQDVALVPILDRQGFADVVAWRDEDGAPRGLMAAKSGISCSAVEGACPGNETD
jgi:release factor glutamine methyltransferase